MQARKSLPWIEEGSVAENARAVLPCLAERLLLKTDTCFSENNRLGGVYQRKYDLFLFPNNFNQESIRIDVSDYFLQSVNEENSIWVKDKSTTNFDQFSRKKFSKLDVNFTVTSNNFLYVWLKEINFISIIMSNVKLTKSASIF